MFWTKLRGVLKKGKLKKRGKGGRGVIWGWGVMKRSRNIMNKLWVEKWIQGI